MTSCQTKSVVKIMSGCVRKKLAVNSAFRVLSIAATPAAEIVCLVELRCAGLFELIDPDKERRERFIFCETPRLLLPGVERVIAVVTRGGSVPPLNLIPPISPIVSETPCLGRLGRTCSGRPSLIGYQLLVLWRLWARGARAWTRRWATRARIHERERGLSASRAAERTEQANYRVSSRSTPPSRPPSAPTAPKRAPCSRTSTRRSTRSSRRRSIGWPQVSSGSAYPRSTRAPRAWRRGGVGAHPLDMPGGADSPIGLQAVTDALERAKRLLGDRHQLLLDVEQRDLRCLLPAA